MVADNEDIDLPPPQEVSNVFAATDLSSCSSYYSNKYICGCLKAKLIRSCILFDRECPDACSRALSIAPNHEKLHPLWPLPAPFCQNNMPMQLPDMNKRNKYCSMQHQLVIK